MSSIGGGLWLQCLLSGVTRVSMVCQLALACGALI
jgi:hypothetical protein